VAEREALVVRSQIGKGSEVSFVSRPSCATTLDAQIEGHRLEITIFHERGHDRVEVAGSFGLAVLLEQAEHLFALHSPNLLCEVNARTPGLGPPPGRDCSCFIPIRTRAAVTSTAWLAIIAGHGFRPLTQKWVNEAKNRPVCPASSSCPNHCAASAAETIPTSCARSAASRSRNTCTATT